MSKPECGEALGSSSLRGRWRHHGMAPSRFEQMSVAQLVERLDDEEAQARQEVVAWREKIAEAEERLEQLTAVRRTLARLQAQDEESSRNPVEDLRAKNAASDDSEPEVLDQNARDSHQLVTGEADRQSRARSERSTASSGEPFGRPRRATRFSETSPSWSPRRPARMGGPARRSTGSRQKRCSRPQSPPNSTPTW